ncbi:MAG: hypothetical protein IJE18_07930 [Bacteroidaceae bacterium]|nr:hypothetical protein [Bacteroidaceae bacterium]
MRNSFIHIVIPIIATLLYVAFVGYMILDGTTISSVDGSGIVKGWGISAWGNNTAMLLINNGLILLSAIFITYIALRFRLFKEKSLLPLHFFLIFQILTPQLVGNLFTPNITALISMGLIAILYSSYQENNSTEKGFLIALILSATSLIDAHILYLLPILIVGFIQMQSSSARTYAAMIIGLITPYWIVWGLGIVPLSQFDFAQLAIIPQLPVADKTLISTLIVLLLGLILGFANLANTYNEKIHTRATNGFINILSVYTALLLIIDNTHYTTYLPLLNMAVALQTAYYFTSQQGRLIRIFFFILSIALIAWGVWLYGM